MLRDGWLQFWQIGALVPVGIAASKKTETVHGLGHGGSHVLQPADKQRFPFRKQASSTPAAVKVKPSETAKWLTEKVIGHRPVHPPKNCRNRPPVHCETAVRICAGADVSDSCPEVRGMLSRHWLEKRNQVMCFISSSSECGFLTSGTKGSPIAISPWMR